MEKKVILLMFLLIIQPAFGQVIISEVLYNPLNTENGGEAILLYNQGMESVDISGWILATKTSSVDATLPPNTTILPGRNLLIADSSFSLNKDQSSWPDAYYEEAMTLGNVDAGVALKNKDIIMDAIGWGDSNDMEPYLYEGTPHSGVIEGQSLRRIDNQDTDDNSADFVAGTPVFGIFQSGPLDIVIDVQANVQNNNLEILSFEILYDDNASKEGVQIKPVAGSNKEFEVSVQVSDKENSLENVKVIFENNEFELTQTNKVDSMVSFKGMVSVPYHYTSGIYELEVMATSNTDSVSKTTYFEYLNLAAITAETSLSFELQGGDSATEVVVVKNIGNQDIDLKIKGTSLANKDGIISLQDIEYSTNNFATSKTLSGDFQAINEKLLAGSELEMAFKINANEILTTGNYEGNIIIRGQT
ncbi:MAG: lamin tail domain-containing protein [archaeon]